jgi:hypothetical protein
MDWARTYLSWYVDLVASVVAFGAGAEPSQPKKIKAALEIWLAQRNPVEKVIRVAAYVSLGDPRPAIEAVASTQVRLRAE